MGEIINICLGGAGIAIGNEFTKSLAIDHNISIHDGSFTDPLLRTIHKPHVFFNEKEVGYFSPRTIFADVDSVACEELLSSQGSGSFYSRDNFIYGSDSSSNNFYKVVYEAYANSTYYNIVDQLYKQVEACENL